MKSIKIFSFFFSLSLISVTNAAPQNRPTKKETVRDCSKLSLSAPAFGGVQELKNKYGVKSGVMPPNEYFDEFCVLHKCEGGGGKIQAAPREKSYKLNILSNVVIGNYAPPTLKISNLSTNRVPFIPAKTKGEFDALVSAAKADPSLNLAVEEVVSSPVVCPDNFGWSAWTTPECVYGKATCTYNTIEKKWKRIGKIQATRTCSPVSGCPDQCVPPARSATTCSFYKVASCSEPCVPESTVLFRLSSPSTAVTGCATLNNCFNTADFVCRDYGYKTASSFTKITVAPTTVITIYCPDFMPSWSVCKSPQFGSPVVNGWKSFSLNGFGTSVGPFLETVTCANPL